MKITYYGTAAAEGIPALFCKCRVCEEARKNRGKDVKTRSQALIDDKILIDFPADTYMHALNYNLPLADIHTCIVTHSHSDHLYERDLWCRLPGIGNNIEEKPLNMYLTSTGYNKAKEYDEKNRVKTHLIKAFEPFCAEGYTITPLRADHDIKSDPVFYIIEKDGKAVLYSHDSGTYPAETVKYLKNCKKHFDFVSLDCTNMLLNHRGGHMGLQENAEVKELLLKWGLCNDSTIFAVNHFSHNGKATHAELEKEAAKYGFIVSYDGLEIEF